MRANNKLVPGGQATVDNFIVEDIIATAASPAASVVSCAITSPGPAPDFTSLAASFPRKYSPVTSPGSAWNVIQCPVVEIFPLVQKLIPYLCLPIPHTAVLGCDRGFHRIITGIQIAVPKDRCWRGGHPHDMTRVLTFTRLPRSGVWFIHFLSFSGCYWFTASAGDSNCQRVRLCSATTTTNVTSSCPNKSIGILLAAAPSSQLLRRNMESNKTK